MVCSRSGWGRARVRNARHTGAVLVVTALTQLWRSHTHAERPPRPTTHNPPAPRLRGIMVCCGCRVLHPMQLRTATYSASGVRRPLLAVRRPRWRYLVCRGSRPCWSGLDFILARLDALSVLSDQLVQDLAADSMIFSASSSSMSRRRRFRRPHIIKLLGAAVTVANEQPIVSSSIPGRRPGFCGQPL